jgi:hypothetical protein
VYSPRTKRVLHRQDVIFLPTVFPMRMARVESGLGPEGDVLQVFRFPASLLDGCDPDLSFGTWQPKDSLPDYDNDISGFPLVSPYEDLVEIPEALEGVPVYNPVHSSFPPSSVLVPIPAVPISPCADELIVDFQSPTAVGGVLSPPSASESGSSANGAAPVAAGLAPSAEPGLDNPKELVDDLRAPTTVGEVLSPSVSDGGVAPRRSTRQRTKPQAVPVPRRPVHDRWFYEPVVPVSSALVSAAVRSTPSTSGGPFELPISPTSSGDGSPPEIGDGSSVDFLAGLPPPRPTPLWC